MVNLHERHENLWLLTFGPAIWAVHFLAAYVTAAVWCAKVAGRDGSLATVRLLIGIYTAAALAGIALVAWRGLRRHRMGAARTPHDEDTPEDRHRFLGLATLLLASLSGIATIYVAITALVFDTCW